MTLSIAVVMLLVGGVMSLWLRQGPTALTTDDALDQFRSSSATPVDSGPATTAQALPTEEASGEPSSEPLPAADALPPKRTQPPTTSSANTHAVAPPPERPGLPLPAEGVYTYLTEGYEWTSALGGSRHDYPKETSSIIRHTECGFTSRWQPLRERWDESLSCMEPGGVAARRLTTHHEFFQRSATHVYQCRPGSIVWPGHMKPGQRWQCGCEGDDGGSIQTDTVFVGIEKLVIGGTEIETDHIHYESVITRANEGTFVQDWWLHRGSGSVVQVHADMVADVASPFGRVKYEEHYRRTLKSLTPQK